MSALRDSVGAEDTRPARRKREGISGVKNKTQPAFPPAALPFGARSPPDWLGVPSKDSRARSTFARNAEVQSHFKFEAQDLLQGQLRASRNFPLQRAKRA